MTALEMISRMFPFYIFGILMLYATYKSDYKSLLRIDFASLKKFSIIVVLMNLLRMAVSFLIIGIHQRSQSASFLPWQTTLLVFWEDAFFTLPLAILYTRLNEKKWFKFLYYPAILSSMIAFGSGHVYQGVLPAMVISLYIPYTIKLGREHGFGTIMAGHILYDLVTIMSVKLICG
jgi:hypothetical protein